jgi:hypothetical protein|tara:strand:+ start:204 stop:515 length:312 start_codon:yes stop_codon:yes gene_type:complete
MTFDFLELFNAVSAAQKVVTNDFIPAESLDTPITESATNLDSLDVTFIFFLFGEVYGIPADKALGESWSNGSIRLLQEFIQEHKTKDPEDEFDSIETLVEELA